MPCLGQVTDFGLSKFVDSQTMLKTFCGTPTYLAPEILLTAGTGEYTKVIDCWSLGVILYIWLVLGVILYIWLVLIQSSCVSGCNCHVSGCTYLICDGEMTEDVSSMLSDSFIVDLSKVRCLPESLCAWCKLSWTVLIHSFSPTSDH